MQILYAMSRDEELTSKNALSVYRKNIQDTFELFLFNLYTFQKICEVSDSDFEQRSSKYIKSDEDKSFRAILSQNDIIASLRENKDLQKLYEKHNFVEKIDNDFLKKIYFEFSKEEMYRKYAFGESSEVEHIDVLLELYRFCRKSEYFSDMMSDNYYNWTDDKSVIVGSVKKVLKSLPASGRFFDEHFPDSETIDEFGENLLNKTIEGDTELLSYIKPTLKNWDHERLAILDMILLKMALIELLGFRTIPTKVTLNEYVEISKSYSTPKSKDFINGVLDRLMKQLEDEGKIKKEGRGLVN